MLVEHDPEVDDVQDVEAQIAEIVVDRLGQFGGRERQEPGSIFAATGANLDNDQIIRVGVKRLGDELVYDCGP